jgi:hypothetical protein
MCAAFYLLSLSKYRLAFSQRMPPVQYISTVLFSILGAIDARNWPSSGIVLVEGVIAESKWPKADSYWFLMSIKTISSFLFLTISWNSDGVKWLTLSCFYIGMPKPHPTSSLTYWIFISKNTFSLLNDFFQGILSAGGINLLNSLLNAFMISVLPEIVPLTPSKEIKSRPVMP